MSHEIIIWLPTVQDTVNDVILDIIRQYIEKYKISVYDEKTHKGNLRHVVTKVGFHTHEIMVILVTKETKLPKIDALVEMLEAKLPGLRTVVQKYKPKQNKCYSWKRKQNFMWWWNNRRYNWWFSFWNITIIVLSSKSYTNKGAL